MLLKILALVLPELKSVGVLKGKGLEPAAILAAVQVVEAGVAALESGKVASQQVGIVDLPGVGKVKYGVFAQKA